jgi:dTDP-4-dehydrorhamnose 3,5-epimerase-like enzyme
MIETIDFEIIGDERGSLISLEENGNIPFSVKRVYYIFDTKQGVSRGYHAHKNLEQIIVCVSGSCRILLDDGVTRESIILNSPKHGVYINNNKWREMHDFSDNCVLMVLASNIYEESDYIRSYDEFLRLVNL